MTINHDPIPTLDVIEAAIRAGDGRTVRTLLPLVPEARDHRDERGQGLLHLAARMGNSTVAHLLIEHSFDPEAVDANGKTPARVAYAHGNDAVAYEVLEQEAAYPHVAAMRAALEARDLDALQAAIDEWQYQQSSLERHGLEMGITSPPEVREPLGRFWYGETLEATAERIGGEFGPEALALLMTLDGSGCIHVEDDDQ
ncbi:ankyrin repeat domain-containing protein [Burkholderia glumae]|uniref:ankyrin repeat domain-containing protein n=1 Tax=Burkholderia glumae TaxID=337 RepID=UPI0002F9A8B8|nr:ankyrin repeat domain-containing protein [Burkholderia glumae]